MKKKLVSVALCAAMVTGMLSGCAGSSTTAKKEGSNAAGKVYYLNFKPEVTDVWEEIAKTYTEKTGVEVKVVTAAGGNYESTLKSEIAKTDAPTLFQINGPIGYQSWKDYCADLKDSDFYAALSDKSLAITKEKTEVCMASHIPSRVMASFTTMRIMEKYFATSGGKGCFRG
ncbi:MAG: extracellular solute-binding protein [Lachnospiraceae bacterium]